MILEEVLDIKIPDALGYMIIDEVFVAPDDLVEPGTVLLQVNTKVGKYQLASVCEGKVHSFIPPVGSRIGIDDSAALYIQVPQRLSDDERGLHMYKLEAAEPVYSESQHDVVSEEVIGSEPQPESGPETETQQAAETSSQREETQEIEPDLVDEGVDDDAEEAANARSFLWSLALGLIVGFIFWGESFGEVSEFVLWVCFGLVFVFRFVQQPSKFPRHVMAAVVFTAAVYAGPYIPIQVNYDTGSFEFKQKAVFDSDIWTPPIEGTWERISQYDKPQSKEKVLERLSSEDEGWGDSNSSRSMRLKMVLTNHSNQAVTGIMLNPFSVQGVTHRQVFEPPLYPGGTLRFSLFIPRARDGMPEETLGKPENERWTRWSNSHWDVDTQPFDRSTDFVAHYSVLLAQNQGAAVNTSRVTLIKQIKAVIAHLQVVYTYHKIDTTAFIAEWERELEKLDTGKGDAVLAGKTSRVLAYLSQGIPERQQSRAYQKDYERQREKVNAWLTAK